MMNFCGPHSNFIPHSPLSYSTSYSPSSPLKEQQVKLDGPPVIVADSGLRGNIPLGSTNKSILKNPTTLFFKEQHKKLMKSNENIVDAVKTPTETHMARKETLKTVAFGLTTRLEDTVLANKPATSSAANRLSKTVIFSHEAQSLHKIILAQQAEIVELRGKVDELMVSDGRRCSEDHEQKSTIAELSSRLVMVERSMANIKNDIQKRREENRENGKTNVQKYIENNLMGEEEADEEDTMNERRVKTSVGKRMVLKQRQLNNGSNNSGKYQNREVESIRSQKRNMAMPSIEEENSLVHRNHILQRLDDQMRKNPNFENRIKSMLRVWTDDMSSPAIGTSILEHPRDESGGGASMVVRVTTQHQEVFYSSSPGRNKKPLSKSRRPKPANQQPIVTELSDESTADEQPETVPNVRRSDLCTDDAEFFHNNEQLEDDFEDWAKRNDTNNQQPFRRRKREATSAIRNKYK